MPVHMRNYYFRELMDLKKKEQQAQDQANQRTKPTIPRHFQPKKYLFSIFINILGELHHVLYG